MLNIIYEDKSIIAIHKPAGVPTQTAKLSASDLVTQVKNYVSKKNGANAGKEPFVGLINRLDQPVEGIVLFGLDKKTTADLTEQLQAGNIKKNYYAAFIGEPPMPKALISDFMIKDKASNLSRIVEKGTEGAQNALLEYTVIGNANDNESIHLADIHLITGRHHQIRLQMANAEMPLLGDRKYGTEESEALSDEYAINAVALCAYKLSFTKPGSDERINLKISPQGQWFKLFSL